MEKILIGAVLLALVSCTQKTEDIRISRSEREIHFPAVDSTLNLNGQQLADIYCQQCHLLPDPKLLKAAIWEQGVLPRMGLYLGIRKTERGPYENLSMMDEHLLRSVNIFPDEPQISSEDWQKIQNFYLSHASTDSMTTSFPSEISTMFRSYDRSLSNGYSYTTMLDYDHQNQKLYAGNRLDKLLSDDLVGNQVKEMFTAGAPVSRLKLKNGNTFVLSMGIMDPSNQAVGVLYQQHEDSLQAILGQLRRPVHMLAHDLNEDGEDDLVISEFGNDIGELSAVFFKKGKPYKKQTLIPEPGARKSIAYDWNQDGKEDLLVLMTQGDERIVLLENEGNGNFREKNLLRFPPVYGSSYFQLVDFNNDGIKDILYVNGDNADYSYSLKPYHGIRIYLNQGEKMPQEAYFFPLYGATEAVAHDFDQDGDLDIVGIAYFADFENQPNSGAVFLENKSRTGEKPVFTPWQLPEARHGRWLTMEVADTDQDGDEDVILGSCIVIRNQIPDSLMSYWIKEGTDLMVLENQLK